MDRRHAAPAHLLVVGREQGMLLMLTDIVSRGGNLLLDIGPAADGTIQ